MDHSKSGHKMTVEAIEKISMLKGSVRCLIFGILSLLPFAGLPFALFAVTTGFVLFGFLAFLSLIGLPFALVALSIGVKVWWQEAQYGDTAKSFRIWGIICAAVGTMIWAVVAGLLGYYIVVIWPNNH